MPGGPGFANAFFKKKGFIESLFKFGMGDAEGEERPVPVSEAEAQVRHQVFSVRGRPFIASVQGKNQGRSSKADGSTEVPDAAGPAFAAAPTSPRKGPTSPMRGRPPQLAEPAKGAAKIPVTQTTTQQEIERAALFRNNLLRSCWKPGLKNEEVQRILTLYEARLMDVMHRWRNEELWYGFRIWKRRTWKLDRLRFILSRAKNHHERKAIAIWVSYARLMKVRPFNERMRMRRSCRSWRRFALAHKSGACLLLKSPFGQLRRRFEAQNRFLALVRKGSAGFLRKGELKGFNKWREYLRFLLEARQRLKQMISDLKGGLRRAFNTWFRDYRIARDAMLHAAKLMKDIRYVFWHRWETFIVNKHARAAALMHWRVLGTGWAFTKLKKMWQTVSVMRTVAARTLRRREWTAFSTWIDRAAAARANLVKLKAAITALSGGKLHRGFNTMREQAAEKLGRKLRMHAALSTLKHHPMARGFRSWLAHARTIKLAKYAVLAGKHHKLLQAFNSWSGRYNEMGLRERKLAGALYALTAKGVRKAWSTWSAQLPQWRKLRDTVNRIIHGRELVALNTWQAYVAKLKHQRAMMKRAGASFSGVKMVMTKWHAFVELRRKLRAGGSSLRNKPLRFATNKWIERAEEEIEIKKKLARAMQDLEMREERGGWVQWLKQTHKQRIMRRGVARMVHRESSRGFEAWRVRSLMLIEQAQMLNKALSTLAPEGRAKRKVFNTWRAPNPMLNAIGAFAASSLKKGFNSWHGYLLEQEAQWQLLEKAALTLSQGCKSRAFRSWMALMGHLMGILSAADAAGHRLIKRHLVSAWNSWIDTSAWLRTLGAAAAGMRNRKLKQGLNTLLANAVNHAREETAQKAARALKMRKERQVWNSWSSAVMQLLLMKSAGGYLRNKGLARGWRQWKWVALKDGRSAELMWKAGSSMRNVALNRVWRHWVERTLEPDVLAMAAKRWKNQAAAHALSCFIEWAERMAKMHHAFEGMRQSNIRRVLNTWLNFIEERLEAKAAINAALSKMRSGACRAFLSWKARVFDSEPDPLLRAFQYLRNHKLPLGWNSWLEFVAERAKLEYAARAVMGLDYKYAFMHWCRRTDAMLANREKIATLLGTMASPEVRAMRKAYNSWFEMRAQMLLMRRAGSSFFARVARAAYNSWLHYTLGHAEFMAKMTAAASKFTPEGRAMSKAYNSWRSYSEALRKHRIAAQAFISNATRKALNSWVDMVIQRQNMLRSLSHMVHRELSRAFRNWIHVPQPLAAPARRWALKPVMQALNTWIELYEEAQRNIRVLMHIVNRRVRAAFLSWIEWATEQALRLIALGGMRSGGLKKGFNSWFDYALWVIERNEQRKRALAAMTRTAEKKCFNSWAELIGKVANPMAAALAQWRNQELSRSLLAWVEATALWLVMQNAIFSMMERHLRIGINTWLAYNETTQRKLQQMQLLLKNIADPNARAMRKGFYTWACLLEAVYKARLALTRLNMRNELKAFGRWCEAHEETLRMKSALALATKPEVRALKYWYLAAQYEARRLQRLTSRTAKALTSAELKAFNSWKANAEELGRMSRAIKSATHTKELKVFNKWHEWVLQAIEWAQQMERARDKVDPRKRAMRGGFGSIAMAAYKARTMRGAIMSIKQRHAKRGINSWREGAAELGEKRARMKEALKAMQPERRMQQRAFNQLKHLYEIFQIMYHAAARVVYREAARAMHHWIGLVEQMQAIHQALAYMRLAKEARAFSTWVKAPPHPAEKTLSRLSQRTRSLTRMFNRWYERAADWGVMRMGLTHIIHSRLSLGLRTWILWSLEMSLMQRALLGMRHGALRRGLNHWMDSAADTARNLELIQRATGSIRLSSWQRVFNTWVAMLMDGPSPLERATMYFKNQTLLKGWNSWLIYDQLISLQLRALHGMRNSLLQRGLRTWQHWAEDFAAWQEDTAALLSKMGNPALTKAFITWAHLSEHLEAMRLLHTRIKMRQERAALHTWVDRSWEWGCMRRAAASMLFTSLAKGMRAWTYYVEAQKEELALKKRAMARWTPLGGSFKLWARHSENLRPIKRAMAYWSNMQVLAALNAMERACALRNRMKAALASLFNRKTKMGFNGWMYFAAERREALEAIEKAVKNMSPEGRAMRRALASWMELCEDRKLMRKAAMGLLHGAFTRAVRQWNGFVEERLRAMGLLRRAMAGKLRIAFTTWLHMPTKTSDGPGEKAARRMMARALAKAFDTWGEMTLLQRLKLRAFSHLVRQQESRALGSWKELMEERRLMARSVAAFKNRSLVASVNTWLGFIEQRKAYEEQVRSFLVSHQKGTRKAFNKWTEVREKTTFERAVANFKNSALSKGWRSWLELMENAEQFKRALSHFAGHYLVKGWSYWEAFSQMRRLLRMGGQAMRGNATRKAFSTWTAVFAETAFRQRRMKAAIAGFQGRIRAAMNSWIEDLRARQRKAKVARQLLSKTGKGLRTWMQYAQEKALQRARMRKAAHALTTGFVRGFNKWISFVEERLKLHRAAAPFRHSNLLRGLNSWVAWSEEHARMVLLVSNFRGEHQERRAALYRWREMLDGLQPLREALGHWRNAELSRAWCSWCEHLVLLVRLNTGLAHLMNRQISKALNTWMELMARLATMAHAIDNLRTREVRRALRRWSFSAEEREEKLRIMRSKFRILSGDRRLLRALNSWKYGHYIELQIRAGLRRMCERQVSAALNRWIYEVHSVRGLRPFKTKSFTDLVLQRQGFKRWHVFQDEMLRMRRCHAFWANGSFARALNKWVALTEQWLIAKAAMAKLVKRNLNKGFNTWEDYVEWLTRVRAASQVFLNRTFVKCMRTWQARALQGLSTHNKARTACQTLLGMQTQHALNTWRAEATALAPLRRTGVQWLNRPISKALRKLHSNAVDLKRLRGIAARIVHARQGDAFDEWVANFKALDKLNECERIATKAFFCPLERKALNTWLLRVAEEMSRRRILAAFKGNLKRYFTCWQTFRKLNAWAVRKTYIKPSNNFKVIGLMTWREVIEWLNTHGCQVSRSPPTLLAALRAGFVYQDLIRKASPYYYVRHGIATTHNRNIFIKVQKFFDARFVINMVGAHKLDIPALREGKAKVHLELIQSFKTVIEASEELGMPEGPLFDPYVRMKEEEKAAAAEKKREDMAKKENFAKETAN